MTLLVGRARLAAIATAIASVCLSHAHAQSVFPQRPDDPRGIDFTKEAFAAHADGLGDDAEPLQQAINRAQENRGNLVLIPEGRYRLGRTVYVWQGIRLIGYGKSRPVFVLGRDTPGFQMGTNYMVHFADNRPGQGGPIVDASEFTFYSAMNNINFELQDGNPAAVAIRFHVAQHSMLTHMDFQVGSARAALEDIGNQASDIHVHGGEYGIVTRRTAPVWQFLLMDSSFDGQRAAAIHTMEAGFTLVRVRFADMPVALKIAPGEVEQLYAQDLLLENIREAGFVAGNWRNAHSAVTLTNLACNNVPIFHSSETTIKAPSPNYVVEHFSLGLQIGPDGREQGIQLHHHERKLNAPATAVATDIPDLPPMEKWVHVRSVGAKAEPNGDDTAALQNAIDQHPVLFFSSGTYRVSAPLILRPDTVLIGLNPGTTVISAIPGSPTFGGQGDAMGIITAPRSGSNIVASLGVNTGGRNPRAAGVVWLAGTNSLLDDVSFAGGGGFGPRGGGNELSAGDLLVQDGGGGIFRGCWPHNTGTRVGLRVANTTTPGRVYQMSVEHHLRIETQFHNAHNWRILALQTEEENPAGAEANAMDIQDSSDLLFANTYLYRVSRNILPKTHAALVRRSGPIAFANVKVFSQTRMAFDNAVLNEANDTTVRSQFFTSYAINQGAKAPAAPDLPNVFARNAKLEKLATDFSNASGLTVNNAGEVFFTDAAKGDIFRWDAAAKKAVLLAEVSNQPQVVGFVPPSSLLAIANERAVLHLNLRDASIQATPVKETAELAPNTILLLPVGLHNQLWVMDNLLAHRGFVFRRGSNTAIVTNVVDEHRGYFYAPDTKTAIIAGGTWRPNLQSSQLAAFAPGDSHYLTSEDDGRTYLAKLENYRQLSTTVFAERGGTSVVADTDGNVYLAGSQVWIYDRQGKEIGVLEIPERPGSLAFGGPDKKTLFIAARSSLYAILTRAAGN